MVWSYWIIAGLALIIVEVLTPGSFFFACIGIGALVGGLCSVFIAEPWAQFLIFIIASLLSIYTIRPLLKPFLKHGIIKSNVDGLIGLKAIVTEPIDPPHFGMVKIAGEIWRAQSDEKISAGSMVEILAVDGTKLKVKKAG